MSLIGGSERFKDLWTGGSPLPEKETKPSGPESKNWATFGAPDASSTMQAVKVQLLYEQREAFWHAESEE